MRMLRSLQEQDHQVCHKIPRRATKDPDNNHQTHMYTLRGCHGGKNRKKNKATGGSGPKKIYKLSLRRGSRGRPSHRTRTQVRQREHKHTRIETVQKQLKADADSVSD